MRNITSIFRSTAFWTVVLGVIVAGVLNKAARKVLPANVTMYLP